MNRYIPIICILFLLYGSSAAQLNSWKTAELDNGAVTVKYRFSEQFDGEGKKRLLIEDTARTVDAMDFGRFVSLMNDVGRHRTFTGDRSSEVINSENDSTVIIYYFSDNPWPIENSDCVARMVTRIDTTRRYAHFSLSAAPELKADAGVRRMQVYHITYTFRSLGNGTAELMITGRTSPPVKVPFWVIKSAFPGAPASSLRKMVKLSKR